MSIAKYKELQAISGYRLDCHECPPGYIELDQFYSRTTFVKVTPRTDSTVHSLHRDTDVLIGVIDQLRLPCDLEQFAVFVVKAITYAKLSHVRRCAIFDCHIHFHPSFFLLQRFWLHGGRRRNRTCVHSPREMVESENRCGPPRLTYPVTGVFNRLQM